MYEERPDIKIKLAVRKDLTNKVLLLDDDPDIMAAMKLSLEQELTDRANPYEILSVYDGRSALEVFEANRPRVIVLDIMLPQLSGLLVMEKICTAVPRDVQPKIIVITGDSGRRIGQYAEALGILPRDYLVKPFRMHLLVDRVNEYAV